MDMDGTQKKALVKLNWLCGINKIEKWEVETNKW